MVGFLLVLSEISGLMESRDDSDEPSYFHPWLNVNIVKLIVVLHALISLFEMVCVLTA